MDALEQTGLSHNKYHECAELVQIYGGGVEGMLDDIAAGMSRTDIAKKIGVSVRLLSRYIADAIPDKELQAAIDVHYSSLISEGIEEIRNATERIDVAKGKALVDAAVLVAQFESPKYRPIKQDLKVTRITVGGLSGFVSEQMPVIDVPDQEIPTIEQGSNSDGSISTTFYEDGSDASDPT